MSRSLTVPGYDRATGPVAPVEGGSVVVVVTDEGVQITGDPSGLRDLARWCLVLADPDAPDGSHVHLNPDIVPLASDSLGLLIVRDESCS